MDQHTDHQPVKYRYIQDARSDYPYAAVLVRDTDRHIQPAAWTFARQLDSSEVEVLLDGHGTTERLPRSTVELHTPPEEKIPYNEHSDHAWEAFLGEKENNKTEE